MMRSRSGGRPARTMDVRCGPRASFAAALGLAAVSALGCGDARAAAADPGSRVVFVQVPRGTLPPLASEASFRDPYPSGARVVVWDPERPDEPPRILTGGFDAAGAPSVDASGSRVLFSGRRGPDRPWRVFEVPIEGGTPVPISPEGANATAARHLPDGRIVFCCDLERTADPRDGGPAYSLYTARPDGSELTRITFNPSSDVDPTLLADGRVLYAAWQPPGFGRPEGGWCLLTVREDGTGVFSFFGSHHAPAVKRRPRQIGGRVVFLASGQGEDGATLRSVALSRPLASSLEHGEGGAWRSAEDWDGSSVLASHRPPPGGPGEEPPSFGLVVVDLAGTTPARALLDDPRFDEVDAVLARPRGPARGHLSLVDPEAGTGELLCLDARLSDPHVTGGAGPDAFGLRVLRALPRGIEETPVGSEPEVQLLAVHDLAADGSVFFEVPADTPLRFQTVTASGEVVTDSGGWIWVRPGEKRGCIGCHEDRERAPSNRPPDVLSGEDPRPIPFEPLEVPPR